MRDFIIGAGFVGCMIKQLMPEATLISDKCGTDNPLVLIHAFSDFHYFFPSAMDETCRMEYEEDYDQEEYFLKTRGFVKHHEISKRPTEFDFIDMNYREYFKNFEKEIYKSKIIEINIGDKTIKHSNGLVWDFDRLFITIQPFKFFPSIIKKVQYRNIALYKKVIKIEKDANTICYSSNKICNRVWDINAKNIKIHMAEQGISKELPPNIVLQSPFTFYEFDKIIEGHFVGEALKSDITMLEDRGAFLIGRNSGLNNDRIDETIIKFKQRFIK